MSVSVFQITKKEVIPLGTKEKTLDEITRALPQGFYTTFVTLNGGSKVLGLREHLRRLYQPARRAAADEATLRARIAELVRANLPGESRVRAILARESGDLYLLIQPFAPLPASIYEQGARVLSAEMTRHDPRIKDTGFILESEAQRRLVGGEIFEILLTKNGKIFEGMTSNFYAVTAGGDLLTAARGILPGVTRRAVLRLAKGEGMRVIYRPPLLDGIYEEAFLTSSSRGVVPVISIDEKPVGKGKAGKRTKRLMKAYWEYVERKAEGIVGDW